MNKKLCQQGSARPIFAVISVHLYEYCFDRFLVCDPSFTQLGRLKIILQVRFESHLKKA